MLTQHDFLTPEECSRIYDGIMLLQKHWVNRAKGALPFFTLGTASYIDSSAKNDSEYRMTAKTINPLMEKYFSFLYERLAEVLTKILNVPISYEKELGLPGFHIFLENKAFENPVASVHFDLQFNSIKWNYENKDMDNPISFTCPIVLPKSGAGLYYWDIKYEDVKDLSRDELNELKESKETLYLPYVLGKLVLHRGLILHQIAPSKDLTPLDERITLQGHGLLCDGAMQLYW